MAKLHDHQKSKAATAAVLEQFDQADKKTPPPPTDEPPKKPLPQFVGFENLVTKLPPEPPLLIAGPPENPGKNAILHRGDKLILGSDSKAGKTWHLLQKCLCIASGKPFMGHQTAKGPVLYCNFELRPWAFARRVKAVAEALGLLENGQIKADVQFLAWNLRGVCYDIDEVCRVAEERLAKIEGMQLAAIAVDPLYKSYGDKEENNATDMGKVMKTMEAFAETFGAAILIAAHFAKGDAAGKNQLDRMSGSGVITRDPDAVITLTRLKAESEDPAAPKLYMWEATLRNMASPEPKIVEFDFPIWKARPELSAKSAAAKPVDTDALLNLLGEDGLASNAWFDAAVEDGLVGRKSAFTKIKDELLKDGRIRWVNGPNRAQIFKKTQNA
jgi:hypothetical protein